MNDTNEERHNHADPLRWKERKVALCLIKACATKAHGGVEVQLCALFTSSLDRCEWPALRYGRFTPGVH